MPKKLLIEKNHHVITLILNRPEVHNAFDAELIELLITALDSIENDADVRAVVLKSNGKNFSAGADLNWMQKMRHYTADENKQDSLQLAQLMQKLYLLNKPTIALVQGAAFGGAVGLIACCDIAIAADTASFCLSEVKIGLIPAVIAPYVISVIGIRQAGRYAMTAERFDAVTAKTFSLIHEVVPLTNLEEKAEELIAAIVKNSPQAVAAVKSVSRSIQNKPIDATMMDYTSSQIAAIRVSAEGQEGLAAFLEKRDPNWI